MKSYLFEISTLSHDNDTLLFLFIFRLKRKAGRMKRRRQEFKDGIDKVCSASESAANILRPFNITGRLRTETDQPRNETDQPELLSTIVDLVQASTAADDRRRTEVLRTVRTPDDLHTKLTNRGFKLSRSATYLRLVPRRGDSCEGKRHVQTVPVKLLRPENNLQKRTLTECTPRLSWMTCSKYVEWWVRKL